eukprot:Gregarina_sp_Poly_1__4649@NODE_2485_length_2067_cov_219_457000_g1577_i0_p1_GENE_NODE_2485_length_2067_cov_219_457000_g1577_i0NODE_2485_length_2067_cov_219_457000_g1577_i0_p1_ORF_typecomplete_len219_score23_79Proteasome/PF00227_26/2_7e21_NODE_2485_length_2067_cov_219_457000_g1577_i0290946
MEPLTQVPMAMPTAVGPSVVAVKYKEGVMMATFTNVAGHRAFLDIDRIQELGEKTLVTSTGDHADYQEALTVLNAQQQEDAMWLRGTEKNACEWRNLMQVRQYHHRNKMEPTWLNMLFAGFKDEAPYLGLVDVYGTAVDGDYFCPGLGQYFSIPDLRKFWRPDLSEHECRELITKCFKIMLARLKPITHQIQFAKITKTERVIESPITMRPIWHTTFV